MISTTWSIYLMAKISKYSIWKTSSGKKANISVVETYVLSLYIEQRAFCDGY